jgi:hypothetical protein
VQSLVAAGSDATFDDVMSALINANVDTISIDAGQVGQLAVAGFDFNEGVDVTVQGTAFLGGGNPVSVDAAHAVLGNAHVTVALQQSDVQQLVAHGGAAFDNVVAALQDAGADQISIDAGQVLQFADAGFTFDADSSVVVHGTAFLSTGDDGGVDPAVKALFGSGDGTQARDVHVDLRLSDAEMHHLASDVGAVADLLARASDAGVDAVSTGGTVDLTADLALALREALADADLSLADTDTLRVVSDQLSLAQTRAADFESVVDLATGINQLMDDMAGSGFESVRIDDELANALAEAGVDTDALPMAEQGFQVGVLAQADGDGDTAFLRASLQDLVKAGVDTVDAANGVQTVVVALRDAGDTSETLGFSLSDLPQFTHQPNQQVGLVVDEDDLAALLGAGETAFETLHDKGFTIIGKSNGEFSAEEQQVIKDAGLEVQPYSQIHLTPTEVGLLGLGTDPQDPFDPFNPHKP